MNAPERFALPDIQSQVDTRNLPIDAVGIRGVRYPLTVLAGSGGPLPTIATLTMTVGLPAVAKGTHMSRFIELLEQQAQPLTPALLRRMLDAMVDALAAESGAIEMAFPYFVSKAAPVSRVVSRLDYDVRWRAAVAGGRPQLFRVRVVVPATSLCPCSKEISEYGAHNQRSHISIEVDLYDDVPLEHLIALAERSASCEVYGLLKRPDEKYVTEQAYDNPKFVEDLVRDVALGLNRDPRIAGYSVEAENFESIHNHSAYARIERRVATESRS